MEEIDLCWRLKNMGYKVMYCAESEVFHLGGGTLNTENPFKTFLNFRNNLLLLKNNLPFWRAMFVISYPVWMDLLAIFRFLNEGKRKDAWAVSRAHQNFVLNIFKVGKSEAIKAANSNGNCKSSISAKRNVQRQHCMGFFCQKEKSILLSLIRRIFIRSSFLACLLSFVFHLAFFSRIN